MDGSRIQDVLSFEGAQPQKPKFDSTGHINLTERSIENALPILEKYSIQLAKKFAQDSTLRYEKLTPLEQAKFRAAEVISISGKDNDTDDQFRLIRKEQEQEIIKQTQAILDAKSIESTHDTVQTTLRKIDDWVDQKLVDDLKITDPVAYEQFVFDTHVMGAKRTKKIVQRLARRAINDPTLVQEEKAIARENNISQGAIDALALRIREPLMGAGLKNFEHSYAGEKNTKQVAKFMLVHMPEALTSVIAQLEKDNKIAKPKFVYDMQSDKTPLSPIEGLLADIGRHTNANDFNIENDAVFAIAQKDIFAKANVDFKLKQDKVSVGPLDKFDRISFPNKRRIEEKNISENQPFSTSVVAFPTIRKRNEAETPKPLPLKLSAEQRVDKIPVTTFVADIRAVRKRHEAETPKPLPLKLSAVQRVDNIPASKPFVSGLREVRELHEAKAAPITRMDLEPVDHTVKIMPWVRRLAAVFALVASTTALSVPSNTTNASANADDKVTRSNASVMMTSLSSFAKKTIQAVRPVKYKELNPDAETGNFSIGIVAPTLNNVDLPVTEHAIYVPDADAHTVKTPHSPVWQLSTDFLMASSYVLPNAVSTPTSSPVMESQEYVVAASLSVPDVDATSSLSPNKKLLSGDFTFEQIPDVIKAYYKQQNTEITPELQREFNKVEQSLANNKVSPAGMGDYDAAKIMVSDFGSDALPLANKILDKIIEQDNVIKAKTLSVNAKPFWSANYPKPSV